MLELGCGYGRVNFCLAEVAKCVVGIDTAEDSIELTKKLTGTDSKCEFKNMGALYLQFADGTFDVVICIQNGICAFGVDQESLLCEALRVTYSDGIILFSTYSDKKDYERYKKMDLM